MLSKKLALAILVGVLAVSIMGCSSTSSTSNHHFIEVHVQNKSTEFINVNHIVSVQPSGTNGASAIILIDTSDGMNGGLIRVTESYEQIVQKLAK